MAGDNENIMNVNAFAQQKAAEVAELRVLNEQLRRRTKRAEHLLETIYDSWTWRIGRVVLFPASAARVIKNRRAGLRRWR